MTVTRRMKMDWLMKSVPAMALMWTMAIPRVGAAMKKTDAMA
jgi:hypothetical protein